MPFFLTPAGLLTLALAAMNLIAFFTMGWDKRQARRPGARRVPEKRLFLLALLGGGLGATAGMFVFHHKTRHWTFRLGFPAILLSQLALGIFLWLRWG